MSRLKKLILTSTILLELIVILIVYLIFFRNSEYEDIVKKCKLYDSFGDYKIYSCDKDKAYLTKNEEIVISANSFDDLGSFDNLIDNQDIDVSILEFMKKNKDEYEFSKYLINKNSKCISKAYESIGDVCCEGKTTYYFDPDSAYISKDSKYGLLNINTCEEYFEPIYDSIASIGKDKFAFSKDNKVGLYTKNGEEILKPEYDYIGVLYDYEKDDGTYISIKGNEIKIFDKDLKEKELKINDKMSLNGVYYDDVIWHEAFDEQSDLLASPHFINVKDNSYFKYNGKDISGKYNTLILKFKCPFDDNGKINNESIIYVLKDGKLVKLDPSLIEPTDYSCGK